MEIDNGMTECCEDCFMTDGEAHGDTCDDMQEVGDTPELRRAFFRLRSLRLFSCSSIAEQERMALDQEAETEAELKVQRGALRHDVQAVKRQLTHREFLDECRRESDSEVCALHDRDRVGRAEHYRRIHLSEEEKWRNWRIRVRRHRDQIETEAIEDVLKTAMNE